ncbi:phosphotransferase enzyme family protein [Brassicibacter mesophilus]|uniref:phosphotransferase enzyme family protein n=1 Tax=Brassicibacter mesophilus TaxID=745119 RepID=UPI003D227148
MLKLKHLFDNRDLAEMLVKNWEYDTLSLDMFNYYRISSNAVYPFKYNGKTRLLRFSPVEEKIKSNLISELDFIHYLRSNGYPALCTVASKNNQELLEVSTPWGDYFAVVFERVAGVQLGEIDYNYDICRKHGKYLGKLHKLSSEYKPKTRSRWSYEDVLRWIEKVLSNFENEVKAMQEVKELRSYLLKLPQNHTTFGLIHYDFELDNIFYDQTTDTLSIIDFDDTMYHWYAMDIEQALDSIMNESSCDNYFVMKDIFIEGYREEFYVSDEMLSYMHIFRRFANLYGYVRILLSSSEVWDNEPEWLVNLRDKLTFSMNQRSKSFDVKII